MNTPVYGLVCAPENVKIGGREKETYLGGGGTTGVCGMEPIQRGEQAGLWRL